MDTVRSKIHGKGLKQRYVAEQLGISEQNLCNKLTGRSRFSEEQKKRLAQLLGVTVAELFGEVEYVDTAAAG